MVSSKAAPSADIGSARVLVTGGSGFVGRALVQALVERGNPVTIADRVAPPESLNHELVTHVPGELADPEVRDRAVTEDTSVIIHLAAITSVLRSVEKPDETYESNVAVTHGLLELARTRGVEQFVLASTNAVVGDIGHDRIRESLPLRPLTPYGATKAACEMLMSGYSGAYGLTTTALRFTNIYGPGMLHKDSFIPRLMRAGLSGGGVEVYGDGGQSRDFVHIDDVVSGILAACDKRYDGTAIIGAGRSISVLELIEGVRAATGCALPVTHVPAKTGEMPAVIVDIAHSGRELGYTPEVNLTEGLRTVWEDFRSAPAGVAANP